MEEAENRKQLPAGEVPSRYSESAAGRFIRLPVGARAAALFVLVALLYSNTLNAPFQLDEGYYLVGNPFVMRGEPLESLRYDDELYRIVKPRIVGFLSFALNYRLHGFSPPGYHVVNILIHMMNAAAVFLAAAAILRTPFFYGRMPKRQADAIALSSSLLFAVHPLQTEAVTYIFQRLASLTAFFYLSSFYCYLRWRTRTPLSGEGYGRFGTLWYLFCLTFALLAMKTKQNSFTLPATIAAAEFFFFTGKPGKRILGLVPILLTLLVIPATFLLDMNRSLELSTKEYAYQSRTEYLITQLRVISTYLRLFIFPINQNLDYDYPNYKSVFDVSVLPSAALLVLTAAAGLFLFLRSSCGRPWLRAASFGILWFFTTLSIESSVIPIDPVINEYRLYLPSFGIFLSVSAAFATAMESGARPRVSKAMVLCAVSVVMLMSAATYFRNETWGDTAVFWRDAARKSPNKPRPHNNLGNALLNKGLTDEALSEYMQAARLDPLYAMAPLNIGLIYLQKGFYDIAEAGFRKAAQLAPYHAPAFYNLGVLYHKQGRLEEALTEYETAIKLAPNNADAHFNIGMTCEIIGRKEKAKSHYRTALKLNPRDHEALRRLDDLENKSGVNP